MAFDIYRGWPFDGALTDNIAPKDGENIIAGMIVKRETPSTAGQLIKATGAADEVAYMAIQNQTDYDVRFSGKMPVIVKNAIVLTDQYVTGDPYQFGSKLQVASGGDAGKLRVHTGGAAPVWGWADGFVVRDSVTFLKVIVNL